MFGGWRVLVRLHARDYIGEVVYVSKLTIAGTRNNPHEDVL